MSGTKRGLGVSKITARRVPVCRDDIYPPQSHPLDRYTAAIYYFLVDRDATVTRKLFSLLFVKSLFCGVRVLVSPARLFLALNLH